MIDENGNLVLVEDENGKKVAIDINIRLLADLIAIATEKPVRDFLKAGYTFNGCRAYIRKNGEGKTGKEVLPVILDYIANTDPVKEKEEKAKREAEAAARKARAEKRKAERNAEIDAFFGV